VDEALREALWTHLRTGDDISTLLGLDGGLGGLNTPRTRALWDHRDFSLIYLAEILMSEGRNEWQTAHVIALLGQVADGTASPEIAAAIEDTHPPEVWDAFENLEACNKSLDVTLRSPRAIYRRLVALLGSAVTPPPDLP
jgi:hypothetical protein